MDYGHILYIISPEADLNDILERITCARVMPHSGKKKVLNKACHSHWYSVIQIWSYMFKAVHFLHMGRWSSISSEESSINQGTGSAGQLLAQKLTAIPIFETKSITVLSREILPKCL